MINFTGSMQCTKYCISLFHFNSMLSVYQIDNLELSGVKVKSAWAVYLVIFSSNPMTAVFQQTSKSFPNKNKIYPKIGLKL